MFGSNAGTYRDEYGVIRTAWDPTKYVEARPETDSCGMIVGKCGVTNVEVDGVMVRHDPLSDPMLFSVAAVAVWNDAHVTLTYAIRMCASTVDMKREVSERLLRLCPIGHHVSIRGADPEILDSWRRAARDQLEEQEFEKWHHIGLLLGEDRTMDISVRGSPLFGRLADEYAWEVLEKVEQAEVVAAIDGDPDLLAPPRVVMRGIGQDTGNHMIDSD
jgi:hypothetical protein